MLFLMTKKSRYVTKIKCHPYIGQAVGYTDNNQLKVQSKTKIIYACHPLSKIAEQMD